MTKERRLAIQMWEDILAMIKQRKLTIGDIKAYKTATCRAYGVDWKYECWLCQYVRKDYRQNLDSRAIIPPPYNGCSKCPLYKWYDKTYSRKYDMCGCDSDLDTLYGLLVHGTHDEQIKAAAVILRALKGEEIWAA